MGGRIESRIANPTITMASIIGGLGVSGEVAFFNGTNTISSSSVFTFNGTQLGIPDGTEALPGLCWTAAPSLGLYRTGATGCAISCAGVAVATFGDAQIRMVGSTAAPFSIKGQITDSIGLRFYIDALGDSNIISNINSTLNIGTNSLPIVSIAADTTILVTSTTGLGINATASATNIFVARRDQNGSTRTILTNYDTGASAQVLSSLSTDAGDLNIQATSIAGGALAIFATDSGFTGGIRIATNGTNPLEIRTNNNAAITISGTNQTVQLGARLGVEAGPGTDTTARIRGQSNAGANQYGLIVDTIHQSSATGTGYGIDSKIATQNASFTMGVATAFQASAASKGAASTITRLINFGGYVQTDGTHNAFITDNVSFTGNWFIHTTGSLASHFSRFLEIECNEDPGAPTDAIRISSKVTTDSGTPNTMHLRTEQAVEAVGLTVATTKARIWWNNVEYWVLLATV